MVDSKCNETFLATLFRVSIWNDDSKRILENFIQVVRPSWLESDQAGQEAARVVRTKENERRRKVKGVRANEDDDDNDDEDERRKKFDDLIDKSKVNECVGEEFCR